MHCIFEISIKKTLIKRVKFYFMLISKLKFLFVLIDVFFDVHSKSVIRIFRPALVFK